MDYYFCPTARAGVERRGEERRQMTMGMMISVRKKLQGFLFNGSWEGGSLATADATGRGREGAKKSCA